jgi:hypothetical protein
MANSLARMNKTRAHGFMVTGARRPTNPVLLLSNISSTLTQLMSLKSWDDCW